MARLRAKARPALAVAAIELDQIGDHHMAIPGYVPGVPTYKINFPVPPEYVEPGGGGGGGGGALAGTAVVSSDCPDCEIAMPLVLALQPTTVQTIKVIGPDRCKLVMREELEECIAQAIVDACENRNTAWQQYVEMCTLAEGAFAICMGLSALRVEPGQKGNWRSYIPGVGCISAYLVAMKAAANWIENKLAEICKNLAKAIEACLKSVPLSKQWEVVCC
jgi:hypothetical protein